MASRSEIEEEIARATHEWRDHAVDGTPLGAEPICNCYQYVRAIAPLLNRVRAEALREAAVKAQEAFVDEQGGIGYARVRTDWLHAEANRIEQNRNET